MVYTTRCQPSPLRSPHRFGCVSDYGSSQTAAALMDNNTTEAYRWANTEGHKTGVVDNEASKKQRPGKYPAQLQRRNSSRNYDVHNPSKELNAFEVRLVAVISAWQDTDTNRR